MKLINYYENRVVKETYTIVVVIAKKLCLPYAFDLFFSVYIRLISLQHNYPWKYSDYNVCSNNKWS